MYGGGYISLKSLSITCYLQLKVIQFNTLKAELNPIRHLLALAGARHIVHVSRVR